MIEVEQGAQLAEQTYVAQSSEMEVAEKLPEESFFFPAPSTQTPLSPTPISMQPLTIPEPILPTSTSHSDQPNTSTFEQTNHPKIIPMLFPVGSPIHTPFYLEGPPLKGPTIEKICSKNPQP